MKRRTLMFLSANHFHVHLWDDGAMQQELAFADNQDGREQFAAFLQTHHHPAFLLTDLIEEDFRHEIIPHLRGRDHDAQLQRKFDQFYRSTPFRQAMLHQRQTEGRRDDEMLFSSLTNPNLILPWLEVILHHSTPLAGIYSVPGISKPLVKNIQADHILLLSWEKSAGLRQTYFNAKRLYLSRLTPVNSGNSFSDVVISETARTLQYLKSLSLLPLGEALQVYIICHADDRRELEAKLHDDSDVFHNYLDIQELGRSLKSKDNFADSDAARLFLHLLAAHPPRSHYGSAEHTHFFELWKLRRSLFWLSALIAAVSLLWAIGDTWEGHWLNNDSATLDIQSRQLTQRTQQIIQGFPSQLASSADMKSAVTTMRKLDNYSPPAEVILAGLSASLDAFPRIRLDHLSWHMNTAGGAATTDAPSALIVVDGELEGWSGGYRESLNSLDRFQQALKQRGYDVSALKLPLDISPKGSIQDNAGVDDTKPPQFSLQLTWRPQP